MTSGSPSGGARQRRRRRGIDERRGGRERARRRRGVLEPHLRGALRRAVRADPGRLLALRAEHGAASVREPRAVLRRDRRQRLLLPLLGPDRLGQRQPRPGPVRRVRCLHARDRLRPRVRPRRATAVGHPGCLDQERAAGRLLRRRLDGRRRSGQRRALRGVDRATSIRPWPASSRCATPSGSTSRQRPPTARASTASAPSRRGSSRAPSDAWSTPPSTTRASWSSSSCRSPTRPTSTAGATCRSTSSGRSCSLTSRTSGRCTSRRATRRGRRSPTW